VSIRLRAPLPRGTGDLSPCDQPRAEWPLVEVVARVVIDHAQCHFVRVTAGGIAPVPLRFERVENALQSRRVDDAAIEQAAGLAIEGARPLPQTGYKLQLLQAQIADVLRQATAGGNMMRDDHAVET
jgi:xanthine dehydrogenase YagS FAD-binding subunit